MNKTKHHSSIIHRSWRRGRLTLRCRRWCGWPASSTPSPSWLPSCRPWPARTSGPWTRWPWRWRWPRRTARTWPRRPEREPTSTASSWRVRPTHPARAWLLFFFFVLPCFSNLPSCDYWNWMTGEYVIKILTWVSGKHWNRQVFLYNAEGSLKMHANIFSLVCLQVLAFGTENSVVFQK